jgi:hypothetical protein
VKVWLRLPSFVIGNAVDIPIVPTSKVKIIADAEHRLVKSRSRHVHRLQAFVEAECIGNAREVVALPAYKTSKSIAWHRKSRRSRS